MDISIGQMMAMQTELQQKYQGVWEPINPQTAPNHLLWGVGEIGEVIDVIKKHSDGIMTDEATRTHFIEEMCDVYMYLADVLMCYGVDEAEFAAIHRAKHAHNMRRRFDGTQYPDEEIPEGGIES